jgi:hypothetical protein
VQQATGHFPPPGANAALLWRLTGGDGYGLAGSGLRRSISPRNVPLEDWNFMCPRIFETILESIRNV